jgi:predicted aspartyl protease
VSIFRVNVVAWNPADETRRTAPIDALVDTGSELTWLPAPILEAIGLRARHQRTFRTATGDVVTRPTAYVFLGAEGFETADEVVMAAPGDQVLLGVRSLEGFGVVVDPIAHRFVAQATIAALGE